MNHGTEPRIVHLCQLHDVCQGSALLQARAAVARMIHAEFWADVPGASPDAMAERLALAVSPEALPLCRVAMHGDMPVGVANLIDYDDPNPRVGRPWLAGLVVLPGWRGRGLGSRLVRAVLDDAHRLGETEVFLGTDGPGFYQSLGARLHQPLRLDFWLLRFSLPARHG